MSARFCAVIVVVVALLLCASSHAQFSGRKPVDMSDGELQAAGYQWESSSKHSGSLLGGVVAVIPGSILHASGHFYMNNSEAGWQLLKAQGLATSFLLTGTALNSWGGEDAEFEDIGILLLQMGGVLFTTSYISNVVGVIKGTESELPDFEGRQGEVFLRGGYIMVGGESGVCTETSCHLLDLSLEMDFESVSLSPSVVLDTQGGYEAFGVSGVWKALTRSRYPKKSYEYGGVGFEISQVGYGGVIDSTEKVSEVLVEESVLRLELSMVVQVGLDYLLDISHLENLVVYAEVGIGLGIGGGARAAFPGDDSTKTYLLLEYAILANLTRNLRTKTYYVYNEAAALAPFNDLLGFMGQEFVWGVGEFELYADGAVGTGYTVSSGVRYRFFE